MSKKPSTRRKNRLADPHAAREAARYARPIPSREVILQVLEEAGQPLGFKGVAAGLGLHGEEDTEALSRRLGAMIRDGQLVQNRRGDYCLVDKVGVVAGTVQGHRDGFGFLIPEDGGEDVFLSPRQMRELMHGDRAAVRISGMDYKDRREGAVVDVLERRTIELVGRFCNEQGVTFVVPDNARYTHEILIPPDARNGAKPGQIVLATIVEPPGKHNQPLGRISKVLGEQRAAGMEVEIAIHSHGLPHQWPAVVEQAIAGLDEQVAEADKRGREDLRHLPLLTIDGEDARDFDDAVYCAPVGNGWRLIVAIADVSHYVRPDTALDAEAQNRATSVYFPDWVIPMLPEALSNGLCSLNPRVDRLCMVCDMQVDAHGHITRARFYEGLMRSAARLTYTQVGALLAGDPATHRALDEHVTPLRDLHALYRVLRQARERRGALDFERPETRIEFDAERKIRAIVPVVRNDAHKLIEECMIAANVAAAVFLAKHKMPTLYRVHEGPGSERLTALREFLGPLGLSLGGGEKPAPADYAKLLHRLAGRPDAEMIETVLLRSLAQAVYSPTNIGHFGLAHQNYLHFTSPIRRYPDLLVHRAIRHVVRGGKADDFIYGARAMESFGHHCSMAERRADEATRDAVTWLKCDYMRDKVGETFDGTITGVTGFGVFVELKGLQIEGLVHVTSLQNDYYRHDPVRHRLIGERSGREYGLTDSLRVKVAAVNLNDRKIDFEPVGDSGKAAHKTRESAGRPTGGKRRRKR